MRTSLLSLIFFTTIKLFGQDSLVDCKLSIKTSPLSLINIYDGPCFKIGTEIKVYKNFSTSFEYGAYIPVGHTNWFNKENIVGLSLKSEFKIYLNHLSRTSGNYISLEYFYKNQNFDFWATIMQDTIGTLKDYHMTKEVSCFNVKYGKLLTSQKYRLFLEYFAGLGVWFTYGTDDLTDTERNNIKKGEGQGGLGSALIRSTGHETWLNITAGLKVGYRLK